MAVHLGGSRFYCTCPFRPKPCVHVLALHALWEQKGESVFEPAPELPEWATDLFAGLPAATLVKKKETNSSAGKQRRRFERLERAANGFEDLEGWLLDLARRGLANAVSENPNWHEHIASRMADASMPSLSRSLRLLGQIPTSAPDWADKTAAVLADCYVAVRAFQKRDALPDGLVFDLQNFIGISTNKEEVLQSGERMHDVWAVVGQIENVLEDSLLSRRTWLFGGKSGRYALMLDFKHGSEQFQPSFSLGSIQQGSLVFYPSAFPQRARALDDFAAVPKEIEKMPGFVDFEIFAQSYATALAAQPWQPWFPAAFKEARPQVHNERFFLLDKNEKSLLMDVSENNGWRLLALSGGHPMGVFGEWDGSVFQPLSAVAEGRFVAINH